MSETEADSVLHPSRYELDMEASPPFSPLIPDLHPSSEIPPQISTNKSTTSNISNGLNEDSAFAPCRVSSYYSLADTESSSESGLENVYFVPRFGKSSKFARPRFLGECLDKDLTDLKRAEIMMRLAIEKISKHRKIIKKYQAAVKHFSSHLECLISLLVYLRKNNLISESAERLANESLPRGAAFLLKRRFHRYNHKKT